MKTAQVIIVKPKKGFSITASLRLFSLGMLQSVFLEKSGVATRVSIGDKEFLISEFHQALSYLMQSQEGVSSESYIAQRLSSDSGFEKSFLWITPKSIKKDLFRVIFREFATNNPSNVFCCPEAVWLFPDRESKKAFLFNPLDIGDQLESFLFYFAKPENPDDLDFRFPVPQDSGNLWWLILSLLERIKLYEVSKIDAKADPCETSCNPKIKELLLLARSFPRLLDSATRHGHVLQFVSSIYVFLNALLSLLGESQNKDALEEKKVILPICYALLEDMKNWCYYPRT